MSTIRKVLSVLLAAALLFTLSVSAAAEGEDAAAAAEASEVVPAADPEDGLPEESAADKAESGDAVPQREYDYPLAGTALLDPDKVSAMIEAFMTERGLSADSYSVAYCYTGTGEVWSYNGDTYFNAASLYKLSLMMGLARKVAAGELTQDDIIYGMPVSLIESRSITYSDNDISEQMINYFGTFTEYRLMQAEIAGVPESELPEEYFSSNTFSANFMVKLLQELYGNTESYPNIIECMKAANPGEYFRLSMDGTYEAAQKYGGGNHWLHTAGIIYTPTPFLLVVMTHYAANAERVIADTASLFADYTNSLDAKYAELLASEEEAAEAERLAEEEAQREAEEAKQAAEQAAQEEAAAHAAEEAARAAEEAAAAQAEADSREAQDDARTMKLVVLALVVVLIGLIIGYAVSRPKRRRDF